MFSTRRKINSKSSISRYDLSSSNNSDSSQNLYPKLLKYHNLHQGQSDPSPSPPSLPIEARHNRCQPERSSSLGSSDSGSSFSLSTKRGGALSDNVPYFHDSYSGGSYDSGSGGSSASSKYSLLNQYRASRAGSSEEYHWRSASYDSEPTKSRSGGGGANYANSMVRVSLSSSARGLLNFGNFCFLNCTVQCLSHTRALAEYFVSDSFWNDRVDDRHSGLSESLSSLVKNMWERSSKSAINSLEFRKQIRRFSPRFDGSAQQDAQEFLRYLLLGVHDEVNRTQSPGASAGLSDHPGYSVFNESSQAESSWKSYASFENSVVVDLFVGQLRSTLTCTLCGHNSVTFDPFWDLSLPLPSEKTDPNLYHCLDLFMEEEFLDGPERPRCIRCDAKRKCSKRFSIQRFPKVLVLHLKRFSSNGGHQLGAKINTAIDYPLTDLDLSRYCNRGAVSRSPDSPLYDLYAVIDHAGYAGAGHYTARCRHPYSGQWFHFNDAAVTAIDSGEIISSNAYILFYELSLPSSSSKL